jgi:hypothetical protein
MNNEQRTENKHQRAKTPFLTFLISHFSFVKVCFILFIFHFSLFFCYAQSTAAEIETLMGTKAVTYAQAARFLLEASDAMITPDPGAAFRYAQERKWLSNNADPDKEARLDEVSLLIMNSFCFKGGILYTITKYPQYAYRELKYNNILQGRVYPGMIVSGDQLLFFTGRTLSWKEEN